MEKKIKSIEKSLDKCQEFIFHLRRFFYANPDIAERYKEFIKAMNREDLII